MHVGLFPRGFVIGLSVAAPVGPMAVICIRRTLIGGRRLGIVSGAGVASADAFYGAVAAFGLTGISAALLDRQQAIQLLGGLFLIWLGWRSMRSPATTTSAPVSAGCSGLLVAYGSTLGLTLTNPLTILSFAAIFAGFGVATESRGGSDAVVLVAGVFAGSCAWWVGLCTAVSLASGWLAGSRLSVINRVAGGAIILLGLLSILSAAR